MKAVAWGATLIGAALALNGCTTPAKNARYLAGHLRAEAELRDAAGKQVGTAIAEEIDGAVRVMVEVHGLAPGIHGTHIHAVGKCEAPSFASAGGHWNPTARQHGKDNPLGAHGGDMPNLKVDADGKDRTIFTLPAGSFAELMDADGSAIVIHAGEDDYKTDPSGNSGARIACGVFQSA